MAGVVLTGNPFADRPVQPVTAVAVVFVDGHVNAAQLQPQPLTLCRDAPRRRDIVV